MDRPIVKLKDITKLKCYATGLECAAYTKYLEQYADEMDFKVAQLEAENKQLKEQLSKVK